MNSTSSYPHSDLNIDVAVIFEKLAKWAKKLRSFDDFLPLDSLSIPEPQELNRRVQVNLVYFHVNYFAFISIAVFITLLMQPQFFLLVVVLVIMWYFVLRTPVHFARQVGNTQIVKSHLEYGMTGFTLISLLYFAGMSLMIFFGVCILVIGFHAACRHVPKGHLDGETYDHSFGFDDSLELPTHASTGSMSNQYDTPTV